MCVILMYAYSVSAKMALTVAQTVTNIAGTPEGQKELLQTRSQSRTRD